jgi:thioredoxin reductase
MYDPMILGGGPAGMTAAVYAARKKLNTLLLNKIGEIEVNCSNETDVPVLFAAGDVTNIPEKQIVVSAGEGAKAVLQAHRYLRRLTE